MTPVPTPGTHEQRSIVQSGYGPVDRVLTMSTTDAPPAPGPHHVQIEVRAASVNPIDWQMIEGNRRLVMPRRFPFVPLFDLAGTVVAVGEAVTRLRVGDEVHADNEKDGGGLSERVNVDEGLVSLKPAGIGFGEAAALPLAGQTALLATDRGKVARGSVVVVIGASGGVGHFVVQIAKALGAHVVGVSSSRNTDFVRALGADSVVDYTTSELVDVLGHGSADVVIDCVGGRERWESARLVLRRGGRFVTIARDYDGVVTARTTAVLLAGLLGRTLASTYGDRHRYIPVFLHAGHQLLDRVDALVSAGDLRPYISRRYAFGLEGAVAALQESAGGRVVGKTILERHQPANA